MKPFYLLFFICLLPFITFSQIQSGKITYKVKAPETLHDYIDTTATKTDQYTNLFFERRFNQIQKAAPYLQFELNFNENQSYFSSPKGMENEGGINFEQMIRATGVYGNYYTDKSKDLKIEEIFSSLENKYIRIQSRFNELNWQIENESKNIAGYSCTKATAIIYSDSVKNIEASVTAWFAPELPFSFGPKEYSGLPGLILGLKTPNNFYFYADEVKLNKRDKEITTPTKGEIIQKEVYDKKMEEMSKEMIRRYEESRK